MKKLVKVLLVMMVAAIICFGATACGEEPLSIYHVTFSAREGDVVVLVPENEKVSEVKVDTLENEYVSAWYLDETLVTKYDFDSAVTGDIKLYPEYKNNKVNVTFLKAGGSGTVENMSVTPMSDITLPAGITAHNATFLGWSDGTKLYQPGDTYTMARKDVAFTAVWSSEHEKITVRFFDYDGTQIGEDQEIYYGGTAVAPALPQSKTEEHEVCVGWDHDLEGIVEVNADGNVLNVNARYLYVDQGDMMNPECDFIYGYMSEYNGWYVYINFIPYLIGMKDMPTGGVLEFPSEYLGVPCIVCGGFGSLSGAYFDKAVVPSSYKVISQGALSPSRIGAIELSEGLEVIEANAFQGGYIGSDGMVEDSFTEITIPSTVKKIGGHAFTGQISLKNIFVAEGTEEKYDGSGSWYKGAGKYYDVDGVLYAHADNSMFYPDQLICYPAAHEVEEYEMEPNTDMARGAVVNVNYTKKFVVSAGVKTLLSFNFYNCPSLEEIVISEGTQTLGDQDAIYDWENWTSDFGVFEHLPALKSLEIPSTVTTVGAYSFVSIGDGTGKLTIPSLKSVGQGSFGGLNFAEFECAKGALCSENGMLMNGAKTVLYTASGSEVVVSDSITEIARNAFTGNTTLTSITLGSGVEVIGDFAFYNAVNLAEFNFAEDNHFVDFSTYFFGNNAITSLTLPGNLIQLDMGVFGGLPNLENVFVREDVREEGKKFIKDIDGVVYSYDEKTFDYYPQGRTDKTFTVPDGVEKINGGAFMCSKLEDVTVASTVTFIGDQAFMECQNLKSVTLLADCVVEIGGTVFDNGWEDFETGEWIPMIIVDSMAFGFMPIDIYVQDSVLPSYMGDQMWSNSMYISWLKPISEK